MWKNRDVRSDSWPIGDARGSEFYCKMKIKKARTVLDGSSIVKWNCDQIMQIIVLL